MADEKPGAIFKAIQSVMQEIEAIPKDRNNAAQGFKFRGIDDVYNSLHPILAKHGVFSTSTIVNRAYSESTSKSGTTMAERVLSIRWRFYATDGSFIETETDGEAMDSGDKASNKAMAVAHKYALLQLFCIPTADEKDTDSESPARAPTRTAARQPEKAAPAAAASTATEPCPDCNSPTEVKTSKDGKKYVICTSCVETKNGRDWPKFVRWLDAKPRTPKATPPISSEPPLPDEPGDLPF